MRDLVYWHIVRPEASDSALIASRVADLKPYSKNVYAAPKNVQPNSYCMNPAFVGVEVAKEMAEAYYSKSHFHLLHPTSIHSFLRFDPFCLNIDPLKHLCRLTVSLDLTFYPRDSSLSSTTSTISSPAPVKTASKSSSTCQLATQTGMRTSKRAC